MSDNITSGTGKIVKPIAHITALIALFYTSDFLLSNTINDSSLIRPVLYAAIVFFYFWVLSATVKQK